jgi:hypothetical protein
MRSSKEVSLIVWPVESSFTTLRVVRVDSMVKVRGRVRVK